MEVYVSFDDGDNWQSLRLNMPATSIRDLIIKDDDVAVGTHGRGFWILDDITPLRQLNQTTASAEAVLFKPQTAYRFKWNKNTDTPLPPDEPAGQNPPDGAIINYVLKSPASGPLTLEILDVAGKPVRRIRATIRFNVSIRIRSRCRCTGCGRRSRCRLPQECIDFCGTFTTRRFLAVSRTIQLPRRT